MASYCRGLDELDLYDFEYSCNAVGLYIRSSSKNVEESQRENVETFMAGSKGPISDNLVIELEKYLELISDSESLSSMSQADLLDSLQVDCKDMMQALDSVTFVD